MAVYTSGKARFIGATAVSALASTTIAMAGLAAAPAANATCASFFGIGNSADCTSTPLSIAIAVGTGAQASAKGLFGSAFALGNGSISATEDAFTFAVGAGNNTIAVARGLFGIATAFGPHTTAGTDGNPSLGNIGFNIALNISPTNPTLYPTVAGGTGNLAVNLFGTSTTSGTKEVLASGLFTIAGNLGGNNNNVWTSSGALNSSFNFLGSNNTVISGGGNLNNAFNVFGSGNGVQASPGPLAIAGSIGRSNTLVSKQQPGININGVRIPNTAAANKTPKPTSSATTSTHDGSAGKSTGGSRRR